MTRIIEIYYEKKEQLELNCENLPLEIYLLNNKEQISEIFIAPLDDNKEHGDKKVFGYIAEDEEHLFFQPVKENSSNTIFHNDEIIKKSVWLKSGDTLQIKNRIINYNVSGDRIRIVISKIPEAPVIIPPAQKEISINTAGNKYEKATHVQNEVHKADKVKKNKLIPFAFIILILIFFFVIFAKSTEIKIFPEPDNMSLKGFFPVIKLDERYLLINGKYTLEARKQGYRTLNKMLSINSNDMEFSFIMNENPGIIQFDIEPEDNNKIYVNEHLLSQSLQSDIKSSLPKYEVEKGEHVIKVVNPRYKIYEEKINVIGKNKQQQYKINLQPDWGIVKFESSEKESKVIIYAKNNKEMPAFSSTINTIEEIELISGEYTIHVSKEKYKDKIESFTIKAEEHLILKPFELEAEDGILNLTSIPSQSLIRIDGQYSGKTPQTLKLNPYKSHTIELSLSGHKTIKKTIIVEPEEIINEAIKLQTNSALVFITVSPKQANLYIDGIKQKENSGKFYLTSNNHILRVKSKGYKEQIKKINISSYNKNISFVLEKYQLNKGKSTKKNNKIVAVKNNNYVNSINQTMLLVKPAIFKMGSKKSEAGRSSNEREHSVQLNYAYYLSEKEISNKQYRQFDKRHNSGSSANETLNSDAQPVVNVSWQNAARFANWLSKKESLEAYYEEENGKLIPVDADGTNKGYRLPFEAEWVLAARGKSRKKYPWNGTYPPLSVSGNFADESASMHIANTIIAYNDKYSVSAPIGSYAKNETGFYDLGGNVSEWCQDFYSPSSGISGNKTLLNPGGPKKGTHRVVRDASWRDASIKELRLSYRSYSKKKTNDIGFRIARYK